MSMGANPTLEDLQIFLNENFDFRYNVLTDMPECKPKNTNTYRMIDKRMMNTLSFEAMMNGVDCKDADVKRFLFSERIPTFHPFKDYIDGLPEWMAPTASLHWLPECRVRRCGSTDSIDGCWAWWRNGWAIRHVVPMHLHLS